MEQSWPCSKVGQCQARIIIWANSVRSESLMLYTKFEGNQSSGFGQECFKKTFTIYRHGGHLGQWPGPGLFEQTFLLTIHRSSKWNLASMGLEALQQKFESINLSDLGQRSNNDLDLWYSYAFMYSFSQLHVPTFSSIVSIKSSI